MAAYLSSPSIIIYFSMFLPVGVLLALPLMLPQSEMIYLMLFILPQFLPVSEKKARNLISSKRLSHLSI